MASEFKGLLQSIAKRLEPQELRVLVESLHLPDELKDQPGEVVLDTLGGSLSLHNLEFVIDAMREIGRNDLYQEVKLFKKTSGKKLPNGVHATPPPENGYSNFDIAESQAVNVRNTLLNMEGSDAITVYRVEEVYTEAREAAENLVRLVRHASRLSRLSRTLHPPSRGSEPFSSPPECSDFKDPSSPPVTGFSKRFVKTLTKSTKSKPKKEKEKSVSQKKFKRSQSARVIKKATLPVPVTIDDDEDSTASDYDVPDFPPPIGDPNAPARSSQTEPRQVPARQHALTSVNQTSPRDAFTLPRQAIPHQGGHQPRRKEPQRPPLAHHKVPSDSESNSEADYDDADTVMFTMQTSVDKKSGLFNGKPDSLQSDGSLRGRHFSRSNSYQSSTCSTPSGETVTPPATLPKPPLKGKIVTPSIPIRQSCVGTMKSGHQNSVSSGPNSLQSRADTTTPNRRMVDVREALHLRQAVGSLQSVTSGGSSASSSRIMSPHPISLAKALEMSSDYSEFDECPSQCSTLVSAFPPYVPSNPTSSMKKMVLPPPTRAKPKMMRPEPQQDYANIGIISTVSPPSTSPPQQHTDVSQLAPIYSTRSSQTPSPTSSDHTTIGGMGPMYKTITVEEQELLEQQEDVCPDYINVKQYVEPVF